MKKGVTIAIIIALAIGLGYYLFKISGSTVNGTGDSGSSADYSNFKLKTPEKKDQPEAVSEIDHVKGNASAKNTLIIYEDFQCPACRYSYTNVVENFLKDFSDTKLVFRHYPLVTLHKNAAIAAYASEAASAQGKFWEMYDKLYTNQNEWAEDKDPMPKFEKYAQEIGIGNIDQFKSDITSKKYEERIERDINEGNNVGIQGTPTYFVNGHKLELQNGAYTEVKSKAEQFINK